MEGNQIMINKRFRDRNGKLTKSISEINKETLEESKKYFSMPNYYIYQGVEYIYYKNVGNAICLVSTDCKGKEIYIPLESSGQFLPDVASVGMEIFLKFDDLNHVEKYIKERKYFPCCLYIGNELFLQNQSYKGTCKELYTNEHGYTFKCSSDIYEDEEEQYKVNSYNFLKNQNL